MNEKLFLARKWWGSLSLNEQNAMRKKHMPENYPSCSFYNKSGSNILEIWNKEGCPPIDKAIELNNWKYFVSILGLKDSPLYRNSKEVKKALDIMVDKKSPQMKLFVPYKCKPDLYEGDCEFELCEVKEDKIIYEFIGTIS